MSESESDRGTTDADYRWHYLSTLWSIIYGLGFPAALGYGLFENIPSSAMAALIIAWGGTVVYIVGPENVKAWQSLRGGE
jgi:hypothetical protein